jgi:hypothetical protein
MQQNLVNMGQCAMTVLLYVAISVGGNPCHGSSCRQHGAACTYIDTVNCMEFVLLSTSVFDIYVMDF